VKHPIRLPQVQLDIEAWTESLLVGQEGTGRVTIEFDFKEWQPISYRPRLEGRKRRLTVGGKVVPSSPEL
jgi:hypothetical protein